MSAASACTSRRSCSQAISRILLAGVIALLAAAPAGADTRVAFVGALSGPHAAAGRDQRDGFLLAGLRLEVLELNDGGDPARAKAIAARLLAENISFVTGFTTSESAVALQRELAGRPVLLLSSAAGPISLAGERCTRSFFSTAPPDDAVHENAGAITQARRYRKVLIVSPPGQHNPVETVFRRRYFGETVSGSAIRDVRENRPDAVYVALAGEAMLSFLRAYEQAGLFHRIPVMAARVEPQLLQQLGPDFAGLIVSVRWAAGLETERSRKFVEAFKSRYGRMPSSHAMQGYDAALLLGEAFRLADTASVAAVAKTLAEQPVEGLAGRIQLAANGFPITDWRAWEVFNESSGAPYLVARERTLQGYAGPHGARCKTR
jgi:branched-chain amino acid transport system substrate-binding protein